MGSADYIEQGLQQASYSLQQSLMIIRQQNAWTIHWTLTVYPFPDTVGC